MKNIYTYLDYRKFLKDACAERRKLNPHFSYRYISQKIGLKSTGFLSMVLNGKRNISEHLVIEIGKILKLKKMERLYLVSLVQFNQAETHSEKSHYYQELLTYKNSPVHSVHQDQYEFYRKWYYSALRELVAIYPVKDNYKEVAGLLRPRIRPQEVKEALAVLTRLGLIHREDSGHYKRLAPVISSGKTVKSIEIHTFHRAVMELARSSLDAVPQNERELSTVTMSIDSDTYEIIKKKTAKLREEVMELARSVQDPEQVYQLNIQLFPMSVKRKKEEK